MKRGEIWTVAGGGDFTSKPRPAVVIQDDRFESLGSIAVCPITTDATDSFVRIVIEPSLVSGLETTSRVMVDKLLTVRRTRLGRRIGNLTPAEMKAVEDAILVFLGFAAAETA